MAATLPSNILLKPMASRNTVVLNNTNSNPKCNNSINQNDHRQERAVVVAVVASVPVSPPCAAAVSPKRDAKPAPIVLNVLRAAAKCLKTTPCTNSNVCDRDEKNGQRWWNRNWWEWEGDMDAMCDMKNGARATVLLLYGPNTAT